MTCDVRARTLLGIFERARSSSLPFSTNILARTPPDLYNCFQNSAIIDVPRTAQRQLYSFYHLFTTKSTRDPYFLHLRYVATISLSASVVNLANLRLEKVEAKYIEVEAKSPLNAGSYPFLIFINITWLATRSAAHPP